MYWIAIIYAVTTPFAIWIELATPRGDCIEERLRMKASGAFTSVSWLFNSGFSIYHMAWAIILGPLVVGTVAIAVVVGPPIVMTYQAVTGKKVFAEKTDAANEASANSVG